MRSTGDSQDMHAPVCIHREGADTAVVCIHGILGSPSHFHFFKDIALEAGCAYISLLLPGHGGSSRAFAASNTNKWKIYVFKTLDELKKRYKRLLLVGHSMGGLLSLYAARSAPEGIDGLFLLALPLCPKLSAENMKTVFAVVFRRKNSPRRQAAAISQSVTNPPLPGYLLWLPNFVRLLLLSRQTRKYLSYIDKNVHLLFSANDELVSTRSIKAARKYLPHCNITLLKGSSHYSYSQADQVEVQSLFERFVGN